MQNNLLKADGLNIVEMNGILDQVEESLLKRIILDSLLYDLMETGYWANEVLQMRISYKERLELIQVVERVKYLRNLYLESVLQERSRQLAKELQNLISDEAWRVYMRLEEVRGMELEYFQTRELHPDFNLELVVAEQELNTRLSAMRLKTF